MGRWAETHNFFLGQLIHVLQCKFSEWLCLQIAKSQNIKVFKTIKQTINLPESKFSNSPIILIFYEDAVAYYVL